MVFVASLGATGCAQDDPTSVFESVTVGTESDDDQGDGDDEASTSGGPLLDLGGAEDGQNPCAEGGCECTIPPHQPCDDDPDASFGQVLGLGCPGELDIDVQATGAEQAFTTRSNFGDEDAFPAREGARFVVFGTGPVTNLDIPGDVTCDADMDFFAMGQSLDLDQLPAPINPVDAGDCDDPQNVGTGDCSNTIAGQLQPAETVNDYAELRATFTVPPDVYSFSFDLAFFTSEYPLYYGSQFNDMFIGWVESDQWTGNVSFDNEGNAISLNSGYLDYRDSGNLVDPDPNCCEAPELHGTCMEGNAGTKWLTTSVPVTPGDEVTLVMAIFDQSDSSLDSYVFLDNFQWGCDGEVPPMTVPIP